MARKENHARNRRRDGTTNRSRVRETIYDAIKSGNYDRAAELIDAARQSCPSDEVHHLLSLEAKLRNRTGRRQDGIDLMRQACDQAPSWLPHFYMLAYYLMEAGQWVDAEMVLDDLIRRSEATNDDYFLDEARISKIICLKKLRRNDDIAAVTAKLSPEGQASIAEGFYTSEDFE